MIWRCMPGAGIAQLRERSPPTYVAWVRFWLGSVDSCFDKDCPTQAQKQTRQLVLWVVIVCYSSPEANSVSGRKGINTVLTRL